MIDKLSNKDDKILFKSEPILIDLVSENKDIIAPKIKIIKSAIKESNCIKFNYYYNKGDTQRKVEPYLLVFRWGAWYLLCYCLDKSDFRLFKLSRLWGIEYIEENFKPREIPEKSILIGDFYKTTITLKALFDESVKHRLIDEYGLDSFTYYEDKLLFNWEFKNKELLVSWILSFGDSVEVIEPESVKEDIIKQVKLILEKYK